MASPATAAFQSTTPGTSMPSASSTSNSTFTPEEVNSKATYSSKLGSAKGRLQPENTTASVVQRQSPMQKVSISGSNPLIHRTSNPSQRNGATTTTNPYSQGPTTASSPALLREGLKVKITLDSGVEYEGTYTSGSDIAYILKMVQQRKAAPGECSNGTIKANREHTFMSIQKKDVADIHVTGSSLPPRDSRSQNGSSSTFRTDSAISGNRFQGERPLKRWTLDDNVDTDISLESNRNKPSTGSTWDQFEANERLFGVTTDYDENLYTTAIDKSHPDYTKRYAEADRKAREIESNAPQNAHVAEERIVDNLNVDDSGLDEEDKYSGVPRDDQPSVPLTDPTGLLPKGPIAKADKYQPPARRANVALSTNNVPLTDPAIISSSLGARKSSPVTDKAKSNNIQTPNMSQTTQAFLTEAKSLIAPDSSTAGSKPGVTQENKTNPPASTSQTAHSQARPAGGPNATATVARDVASAFKNFATQQRFQADKMRNSKARADKEVKLHELKKFAASFKLNSPVPSDLVSIIAKDPAKQREIQEKARRNAEEQAEQLKQVKLNSEAASSVSTASDFKAAHRPAAVSPHGSVSTSGATSRQTMNRGQGLLPQGPHNSQSFRNDRPNPTQNIPLNTQGRPVQGLGARLRGLEQNKNGQVSPQLQHDPRQPPIGPANSVDPGFSRRSSGMMGNKLNPNINEFKPNPFAASFSPNGNRSAGSSPRSNSTGAASQLALVPFSNLVRRKRLHTPGKPSNEFDIIESAATIQPPAGPGKKWDGNGGVKPAYDTLPTFRQISENEPSESSMHQTYVKLFESTPYLNQTMSPPHPPHVHPHVPHQHQLPFHLQQGHLQQGPHNLSQRQSPRQPQIHLHNNQHSHGPSLPFNNADDHRMMPSHSAQSFASPRLQPVNIAYPSPMGQPAQLAYNQPSMQYPMAPGGPQIPQYRSYSGGHQFLPQQAPHMAGPVMMPAPTANGFIAPGGIVSPAPQMIYPAGQPHFVPQGNGPPPMPGSNGYPSPGRSAPMMMTQSSQPGQSVYGMSPGMQYGQPLYAQQQPGPMRGYASQGQQQFGTSPQMHQYGPPHRGAPNGGYNKNYQPQHNPHPPQNPIPTGPQARQPEAGEDAK